MVTIPIPTTPSIKEVGTGELNLPQLPGNIAIYTCFDGNVAPTVYSLLLRATGAQWGVVKTHKGGTRAYVEGNAVGIDPAHLATFDFQEVFEVEQARKTEAQRAGVDPAAELIVARIDVQHAYCSGHGFAGGDIGLTTQYRYIRGSQFMAASLFADLDPLAGTPLIQLVFNQRTGRWIVEADLSARARWRPQFSRAAAPSPVENLLTGA